MDLYDFQEIGESVTFVARCKRCGAVITLTLSYDVTPELSAQTAANALKEHRLVCK